MVVSVGIDVSKDKHDCFIVSSEGEVLADVFTIPNTMDGFAYLAKKRAEGKHYNVALSHATKKLVRLIFSIEKSGQPYCAAA